MDEKNSTVEHGKIDWSDMDPFRLTFFTTVFTFTETVLYYPFWVLKTRQQTEGLKSNKSSPHREHQAKGGDIAREYKNGSLSFDDQGKVGANVVESNHDRQLPMKDKTPAIEAIHKKKNPPRTRLSDLLSTPPSVLYRGFWLYTITSMPSYWTYFLGYSWAKESFGFSSGYYKESISSSSSSSLETSTDSITANTLRKLRISVIPMIAGAFADLVSLTIYVPSDLIAQRAQLAPKNASLWTVIKQVYDPNLGWRLSYYKGFHATLLTTGSGSAVWWMSYENSKKKLQQIFEENEFLKQSPSLPPSLTSASASLPGEISQSGKNTFSLSSHAPVMIAGSIASTITSICTNPLDVYKTRLQTSSLDASIEKEGIWKGLRGMVRKEGLLRLWTKGLAPKLFMTVPLGAFSSTFYEFVLYMSLPQ